SHFDGGNKSLSRRECGLWSLRLYYGNDPLRKKHAYWIRDIFWLYSPRRRQSRLQCFLFLLRAQPSRWLCFRANYIRPGAVDPQRRVAMSVRGLLKQALERALRLHQKGDYFQ